MIAAVDLKVNEYEKKQKLLEILSRTENKTYTKLKNGHVFRKQDLMKKEIVLLHEGLVYWKTATGRFKDTLALLLTDVLLFLQEKDQKYIFAAVDRKPSVISLQKLIVREVANEERGMFLISTSSAGPEMYEVHTNSKEERNNWMRHIQDAVESCPQEEEGKMNESDEDRHIAEAKASRIQKCQESLNNQDHQICSYLEEKLRIYAELGGVSGFEGVHVEPYLLIKPNSGETPQAASLVAAALREGKFSWEERTGGSSHGQIIQAIQNLTCLLYSIQAALAIQDSHRELNRLLLQENEKTGFWLNLLPEQEKHQNLEKQKAELANIHKLKQQFQQEQHQWLHECDERQRELEAKESWLGQRERECRYQEKLLERSQQELVVQLQEYHQSLERLQEGQKKVERERASVKMQKQLLWHWKHCHQMKSLATVLVPGQQQSPIMGHNQSDGLCGKNTFCLNEAVVCMSLSSLNRSESSLIYEVGVYGLNISNSDMAKTSENQVDLEMDTSCQPTLSALWISTGPYQQMSFFLQNQQRCL
uniref:PH domain-containing protein n=1 Tax=Athene cunicularia TaxID=194338 RepID=A0A663N6U2_ATHCN